MIFSDSFIQLLGIGVLCINSSFWLIVIYFQYGLAFFIMGLAILLQYRQFSKIALAREIWRLGAFGTVHGLAEWGVMFTLIKSKLGVNPNDLIIDHTIVIILLYVSFIFLFQFGVNIITLAINKLRYLSYLPWILGGFWLINFVFFGVVDVGIDVWLEASNTWSRYLICFPGALFAGVGFILQKEELAKFKVPNLNNLLIGVSSSFFFYSIVAGVVVPNSFILPMESSAIEWLTRITPLLRSLSGIAMAYFTIRVMGVFYLEYTHRLDEVERKQTLSSERERISRDLHDGVIQSLFAIGLQVEDAYFLSNESIAKAQYSLKEIIQRLNNVILDIRFFIQNLRVPGRYEGTLYEQLEEQLNHFSYVTQISSQILAASKENFNLSSEQLDHLHQIVQEALVNVAKHSEAKQVSIELCLGDGTLELSVVDNGKGMQGKTDDKHALSGNGLRNIEARVHILNGDCHWQSSPGNGTRLNLRIPLTS